jgi:hypothetical protein
VAACQHDRRRRVAAPSYRKDVSDTIDVDRATGGAQPRDDAVATLPVEIRQREAADAALRRCADLREIHQRAPQSRSVDAHCRR